VTGPVLRLCASYSELPREQCAVPDRCEQRACYVCFGPVHYDPAASIPILGAEIIVCGPCFEKAAPK
jgi:hypothetical protein